MTGFAVYEKLADELLADLDGLPAAGRRRCVTLKLLTAALAEQLHAAGLCRGSTTLENGAVCHRTYEEIARMLDGRRDRLLAYAQDVLQRAETAP